MRVLAWPAFRKEAANPYAALLARGLAEAGVEVTDWTPWRALGPADLWHLHFPHVVFDTRSRSRSVAAVAVFAVLLQLARLRHIRVVWTVHDLGSNEAFMPRLQGWFWRFLTARLDGFIALSPAGLRLARETFPALRHLPGHLSTHGLYIGAYPSGATRAEARRRLGLPADATVLLHFGLLRAYKNVGRLLAAFRDARLADTWLLMAGRPFDPATAAEVRDGAATVPSVRLALGHVPVAEVQHYFAASDLVVLPYRTILNSGTAMLALTFGRPVLVPALGAMPDLQVSFGVDRVRLYEGELTPDILIAACAWARHSGSDAPLPIQGHPGWDRIGRDTRAIYASLLGTAT